MFCSNCGKQIDNNVRFCPECGAKTNNAAMGAEAVPTTPGFKPAPPMGSVQGQRVTENIYLCTDGIYRWVYEYKMMSNPTILITIYKVLGISLGAIYLFNIILSLIEGDIAESIGGTSLVFGILAGVFLVIGFLAYVIVAAQNGWKYTVMFEMGENGINHKQMDPSVKKASVLQEITLLAGFVTGNPTMMGTALLMKTSLYSEFSKVRNIKVKRGRHTIYVNAFLEKNQVYAEPADFDFVLDYISARLPSGAVIK